MLVGLRRIVTKDFVTSNGIRLKKGDRLFVDSSKVGDPEVYPDPKKFDIYRYYRMREDPATMVKAQLVSTNVENLAFGIGTHACPGRFFAATELKITLSYLLLNYDWELSPCSSVQSISYGGIQMGLDPTSKIRFKHRKAELYLESLV